MTWPCVRGVRRVVLVGFVAALGSSGCAMDELVDRCLHDDEAACELTCQRGIAGDGGCLSAATLAERAGSATRTRALFHASCVGGTARGCLAEATLLERDERIGLSETVRSAVLAERETLLERACQLASETPAPRAEYLQPTHDWGLLELWACAELGRTSLGSDEKRSRQAFESACAHSAERAHCRLKFDERLATTAALVPRCQAPFIDAILAGRGRADFGGAVDDERLLACGALAPLLDPIRGRSLAEHVCIARNVGDACSAASLLEAGTPLHALRQPPSWLAAERREPVIRALEPALEALVTTTTTTLVHDGEGPSSMQVDGGLEWQAVYGVLDAARPRFARCWAGTVAGRHALKGTSRAVSNEVRLTFEVDAVGVVYRTRHELLGRDRLDGGLGECLERSLATLRFAVSGRPTHVVQGLSFETR